MRQKSYSGTVENTEGIEKGEFWFLAKQMAGNSKIFVPVD
jgi:hypothetical protein